MNLKGFLLEDGQGREFVMVCERSHMRLGKTFALRGWQRRRLVPLHHTKQELREIAAGVLITLNDLFESLPELVKDLVADSPEKGHSASLLLKRGNREGGGMMRSKLPH